MVVRVLAACGLALALYTLVVQSRLRTAGYRPLCDIGKRVSCSKAFMSSTGALFGIPNPILGLVFYTSLLVVSSGVFAQVVVLVAFLITVYLAYVSYVRQRNFCVVCTATYLINTLLLFFVR